jgi:hypothetical protein
VRNSNNNNNNNNNNNRERTCSEIFAHIVLLHKFCATEITTFILAGKPFLKIHRGEFKNYQSVGVSAAAAAAAANKHWEVILALPKALRANRKHRRTDVAQIKLTVVMMTLLPAKKRINYVSVLTWKPV